jgi:hypothetical protein
VLSMFMYSFSIVRKLNILCYYFRATILYDQPPEFFRPASLEEKHKVNNEFTIIILIQKVFILLNNLPGNNIIYK